MDGLWLGYFADDTLKKYVVDNGGRFLSGSVSQDNLIIGLKRKGLKLDSININQVSEYPRYRELLIKKYCWRDDDCENVSVGYINLKYLNILSKKSALISASKKWAGSCENKAPYIFVYSMHSPLMAAAVALKRIIPNAKIILIVPDLPQFMDLNMSVIKRFFKSIDWKNIMRYMSHIDKYILYSKHMADFLKLGDGDWTVMEGSLDPGCVIDESVEKTSDKISVMYSGVLDMRYGIKELLDAMKYLDDRFELWLTGTGNAVPFIKEKAETDVRINYFGYLPSRRDLLIMQKQATMLISTRNPSEVASRYCFPSKLFEYMVSGNPVISCYLDGIPDEYREYLIELKNVTPDNIADSINTVADMNEKERDEFGAKAKNFVLSQKNRSAQATKIYDYIKADKEK